MPNELRNTIVVVVAALTAVNLLVAGFTWGVATKRTNLRERERPLVIAVLPSQQEQVAPATRTAMLWNVRPTDTVIDVLDGE